MCVSVWSYTPVLPSESPFPAAFPHNKMLSEISGGYEGCENH